MQNGEYRLRELFDGMRVYAVPPYQRAYAWDEKQLNDFYNDLGNQPAQRPYFFGSVLLEGESTDDDTFQTFLIVDGQQRLTTVTVFMACAITRLNASGIDAGKQAVWHRLFIKDGDRRKFLTVDSDEAFFAAYILGEAFPPTDSFETPSQRRLWTAKRFFQEALSRLEPSQIVNLIFTVEKAKVLVYAVESKIDAAQIFELNNDRGKRLTDLESIKSFLMYSALLHANNPADLLKRIESEFTHILRIAEACEELGSELDEDAILRYHCVAFEQWKESEYNDPKKLVRSAVKVLERESVSRWVEAFCTRLRESFEMSKALVKLGKSDGVVGDLFALRRVYQFFPLLLKMYKHRDDGLVQFSRVVRLMEIFSFRAYGIADMRSDTASRRLYTEARDFCGHFESLVSLLREMCTSWWRAEERFLASVEGPDFYSQGSDARYCLWKYENHLRGHSFPPIPLVDFLSQDNRTGFSIEHIAAQKDDDVSSSKIEIDDRDEEFSRTYLHSIGNLVLNTRSDNSRKGCDPFLNKLASYQEAPLRSQLELAKFAEHRGDGPFMWNKNSILKRKSVLVEFAKAHWSPASV